eukprot:TRINITY_DN1848_c0_g1_i2.p1 TRINITY_DN1848_c0_g1~~TRINITY_DN1848_c0_g1_i2.p1  ORF type:complete len:673 (-),score=113.50 TRINITY_DN1848_c0_g1_i2:50-2068(-)
MSFCKAHSIASFNVLCCALILLSFSFSEWPRSTAGFVSAAKAAKKPDPFEKLFSIDITTDNFEHWLTTKDNALGAPPRDKEYTPEDSYMLVDFYASWCPHCKAFAPHYEKLAESFNAHETPIWAARINCVRQSALCRRLGIVGYPTVKLGLRSRWLEFLHQSVENDPSKFHIVPAAVGRMAADDIMGWLNKRLKTNYVLTPDSQYEQVKERAKLFHSGSIPDYSDAALANANLPDSVQPAKVGSTDTSAQAEAEALEREKQKLKELHSQADLWDVEKATATLLHLSIISYFAPDHQTDLLKRGVLTQFMELLEQYYPRPGCRESISMFKNWLNQNWKVGDEPPSTEDLEKSMQICGHSLSFYEERDWRQCLGSTPEMRGYTCGLWNLFHTLVAQFPLRSANTTSDAWRIRTFLEHFFMCDECRNHFLGMSVNMQRDVSSQHDAVLWFWNAHNQVNKRLVEQGSVTGNDPEFPKIQWPSYDRCQRCHIAAPSYELGESIKDGDGRVVGVRVSPGTWDFTQTYQFLMWYYHGPVSAAYLSVPLLTWNKPGTRGFEDDQRAITRADQDQQERHAREEQQQREQEERERLARERQEREVRERVEREEREAADQLAREHAAREEQARAEKEEREREEREAQEVMNKGMQRMKEREERAERERQELASRLEQEEANMV